MLSFRFELVAKKCKVFSRIQFVRKSQVVWTNIAFDLIASNLSRRCLSLFFVFLVDLNVTLSPNDQPRFLQRTSTRPDTLSSSKGQPTSSSPKYSSSLDSSAIKALYFVQIHFASNAPNRHSFVVASF
jgi:hypothetical protein